MTLIVQEITKPPAWRSFMPAALPGSLELCSIHQHRTQTRQVHSCTRDCVYLPTFTQPPSTKHLSTSRSCFVFLSPSRNKAMKYYFSFDNKGLRYRICWQFQQHAAQKPLVSQPPRQYQNHQAVPQSWVLRWIIKFDDIVLLKLTRVFWKFLFKSYSDKERNSQPVAPSKQNHAPRK